MNIWDIDKLILFIAFVIPGFISIKTYSLLYPGLQQDSTKQLVDAVAYSSLNYAILLWPIQLIELNSIKINHPGLYSFFFFVVLFMAPIVWVVLWKVVRSTKLFQNVAPHPTQKPWDFVFSKRKPYWIKVTLKDGIQIAGKYAGESFASSSPAVEQLYLEETWILNDKGGFMRAKKRTAGVLIMASDISFVELMDYEGSNK
jgi:hypothetical protein